MSPQNRYEQVLAEYEDAPRLMLVFPRSGQTWQLRLTPGMARGVAAELGPAARVHRALARWRVPRARGRRSWRAAFVR